MEEMDYQDLVEHQDKVGKIEKMEKKERKEIKGRGPPGTKVGGITYTRYN